MYDYSKNGNRLKKEGRVKLFSLLRLGKKNNEIAEEVGCSTQTVIVYKRRLKLAKVPITEIPAISNTQIKAVVSLVADKKKTLKEACRELELDYSTISLILSGNNKVAKKKVSPVEDHEEGEDTPAHIPEIGDSPLLAMATPCNNKKKIGRYMSAVQKTVRKLKNDDGPSLLKKTLCIYNVKTYVDKYANNDKFYKLLKFESVIDTHAGNGSYWRKHIKNDMMIVDNDIVRSHATLYHLPADMFLAEMYAKGIRPDVVDLDGFENTFSVVGMAAIMAQKGLIMTVPTQNVYRAPTDYKTRVWGSPTMDKNKCIERAISILNGTGQVFEHVLTSNLTGGVRLYFIKKNK